MKKIILLLFVILTASVFSNVFGQLAPAGAGDKILADNDIKMRSVELDRVKRDANKSDPASYSLISPEIKAKFPQIKEDFESVQTLQAAIIKAYTTGKTIDYSVIKSSAEDMNRKAKRLDDNLFATKLEEKEDDPKEKTANPKSIRDLIIELDESIGVFVSSPIFKNTKLIDPKNSEEARLVLEKIFKLSGTLSKEAKRKKQL